MMSRSNLMMALAFVALIAVSPVFAQGPVTQPRPQAPAASATAVAVPVSKVAVVFSEAFQDSKMGIARFSVLVSKLNGEFQKTQDDLTQTATKLKQLQDEINNLQRSPGATPAQIQAKISQLDQGKKDYQRRGEDAQAQYQKRRQELFEPLQDDIGKALDVYAKAHGITMVIDGSQVQGILYAADAIDITRAFISEYNIKNPATSAATTPR